MSTAFRIVMIGVAGVLSLAPVYRAFGQDPDEASDKDLKFCSSAYEPDSAACHTDAKLEHELDRVTDLFKKKDYKGASQVYLDAFRDTPLRPIDGPAYGLMIASLAQAGQFELAMQEVLRRDHLLAHDDYRLWPDIALVARALAVNTSVETAQATLAKTFGKFPSKLRSRVWPVLPRQSILYLGAHKLSSEIIFKADTQYPKIRRDIEKFVAANPSEPFVELAYLSIGLYDEALAANSNSVISDVLHYAKAYSIIEALAAEARAYLDAHPEDDSDRPLGGILPSFRARAAAARPHLEAVLREAPRRPHADDAAFWLGWLAYHEGRDRDALQLFCQAMLVGNGDYHNAALRWSLRVIEKLNPAEQAATVASQRALLPEPAAWYVASRSAYREFDYALAIETAERALAQLKIPEERLPTTTDPLQISNFMKSILYPPDRPKPAKKPDADDDADASEWEFVDPNLVEIPYIIEAAREMLRYEAALEASPPPSPDELAKAARAIIAKYSTPSSDDSGRREPHDSDAVTHTDYRQAIRMIDVTLQSGPKVAPYAAFRQWLHYRKVRLLVGFAPKEVVKAVADMEREFATGDLMDDALAEQLFVEVTILRKPDAARRTFNKIVDKFPKGNAVDNAYNWMAIMLYCDRRLAEAKAMDRDIIRRFPLTRHAYYAIKRLASPPSSDCSEGRYVQSDKEPQYRMRHSAAIYLGASRQNPVLLKVATGARVIVSEKQGEWYTVKLGRTTGYVPADDLECFTGCPDDSDHDTKD